MIKFIHLELTSQKSSAQALASQPLWADTCLFYSQMLWKVGTFNYSLVANFCGFITVSPHSMNLLSLMIECYVYDMQTACQKKKKKTPETIQLLPSHLRKAKKGVFYQMSTFSNRNRAARFSFSTRQHRMGAQFVPCYFSEVLYSCHLQDSFIVW